MADTKIAKKATQESPKRNVTINRATDYGIMYSDTTRMSMSAYDIKVTFSVNESLPNNDVLITEMVTIALTPQHAKDLAESLTRNVERYEREVMPLNVNEKHQLEHKESLQTATTSKKTILKI
jgi:hypothetical protein